ncbi:hypothetical protein FRB95_014158 [Tulasnella sp. JGI-2019a]|nr:hypothetical protein FRB95_014158 [Tulasnella sp. JGI-2019a]
MTESAYQLWERFIPVPGANGMYRLPPFWRYIARKDLDMDDKLAVVAAIYEMDLLPLQESLISLANINSSDHLNALRQLDEASKMKVISDAKKFTFIHN